MGCSRRHPHFLARTGARERAPACTASWQRASSAPARAGAGTHARKRKQPLPSHANTGRDDARMYASAHASEAPFEDSLIEGMEAAELAALAEMEMRVAEGVGRCPSGVALYLLA